MSPDVHPGVAAGEGEVVEGLRVAAAVLVGQQHAVIPQDEIVQEAVEVDHGHVAEGVIAALSRAAGEGLVVIAPLVGHEIQDAAGRGGPLALQLAGVRHLVLILRHGRGGGLPAAAARRQGQQQRQHSRQPKRFSHETASSVRQRVHELAPDRVPVPDVGHILAILVEGHLQVAVAVAVQIAVVRSMVAAGGRVEGHGNCTVV